MPPKGLRNNYEHNNFAIFFYFQEAIELGIFLQAYPLRIRVYGLFNLDSRFTFSVTKIFIYFHHVFQIRINIRATINIGIFCYLKKNRKSYFG